MKTVSGYLNHVKCASHQINTQINDCGKHLTTNNS